MEHLPQGADRIRNGGGKNKSSQVGKGKGAREKCPSSLELDCECPLCQQQYGEQSAT